MPRCYLLYAFDLQCSLRDVHDRFQSRDPFGWSFIDHPNDRGNLGAAHWVYIDSKLPGIFNKGVIFHQRVKCVSQSPNRSSGTFGGARNGYVV